MSMFWFFCSGNSKSEKLSRYNRVEITDVIKWNSEVSHIFVFLGKGLLFNQRWKVWRWLSCLSRYDGKCSFYWCSFFSYYLEHFLDREMISYHYSSCSSSSFLVSARQHICYSALYAIARPSVCLSVCLSVPLSVTRVDQSKTVTVRITQPLPQSSPMTLVSSRGTAPWNSNGKIGSGGAE